MIKPIQYLRALAALMVVWYHSFGQVPGIKPAAAGVRSRCDHRTSVGSPGAAHPAHRLVCGMVAGLYFLVMRDKPPFMDYSQILGAVLVVGGYLHPAICALRSHVLLALGDASYSIYLTHIFTLGALRFVWSRLLPNVSLITAIAFVIVALIVCAAAGFVAYRWVEKPLTARLRLVTAAGVFKATPAVIR